MTSGKIAGCLSSFTSPARAAPAVATMPARQSAAVVVLFVDVLIVGPFTLAAARSDTDVPGWKRSAVIEPECERDRKARLAPARIAHRRRGAGRIPGAICLPLSLVSQDPAITLECVHSQG